MGVDERDIDLVEAARGGAPEGERRTALADDGTLRVEFVARPEVGMAFLQGVPYVAALGVADALASLGAHGVGLAWPHDVTGPEGLLASVGTTAGYGEGRFVVCRAELDGVTPQTAGPLADAVVEHGLARVSAWAEAIRRAGGAATPLGPVLDEVFERTPLMGRPVRVVYPNGNLAARGTLAGMDVWGRATVRAASGREVEVAAEQASIEADPDAAAPEGGARD